MRNVNNFSIDNLIIDSMININIISILYVLILIFRNSYSVVWAENLWVKSHVENQLQSRANIWLEKCCKNVISHKVQVQYCELFHSKQWTLINKTLNI